MSTSSPKSPSSTRDQLDELDALLQRMLALPVNHLDEGIVVADARRPEPPAAEPTLDTFAEEYERPALLEGLGYEPPPLAATAVAEDSGVAPAVTPAATVAEPQTPRVPGWLVPLVWGNRAFDRCAGPLGRPGGLLRRRAVRNLLGWTGVALLATAVALVVLDRLGLDLVAELAKIWWNPPPG